MKTIRLLAFFLVGFLLSAVSVLSYAAAVPLRLPSNVSGSAGAYVSSGAAAFSGAAYNSGLTGVVNGTPFVAPAAWRLAANAGQLAVGAVRATPTGLIGGAVAAWLLEKGLRYAYDKWQSKQDILGDGYLYKMSPSDTISFADLDQFRARLSVLYPHFNFDAGRYGPVYVSGVLTTEMIVCTTTNSNFCFSAKRFGPQSENWRDANEDDFLRASTSPLPDSVASELAGKGVPLPLQNPLVNTNPQKLPMSDPYYDPVTKKWYRDVLTVSPGADGTQAQAVPSKEEVDENGEPVKDEEGNPAAPKEETDHCKLNPESLGCMKPGEPEDIDLQNRSVNVAINPVFGFGADNASCPADQTVNLGLGGSVAMSWAPLCQFSSSIRPVVVGVAWLSAALIFLGIARRES